MLWAGRPLSFHCLLDDRTRLWKCIAHMFCLLFFEDKIIAMILSRDRYKPG
jgi:hypothetical protein